MNTVGGLLRALRGPLMLMILGGLMALARFQNISFTKTWPVLLIVLGLLKLAEMLATRPGEPTTAGGD